LEAVFAVGGEKTTPRKHDSVNGKRVSSAFGKMPDSMILDNTFAWIKYV